MNTKNETVVSGEMMKKLREAGAAEGYEPVPRPLESRAKKLLKGGHVASMDSGFKKKIRQLERKVRQLEGNRKREAAMQAGRESELVKVQR